MARSQPSKAASRKATRQRNKRRVTATDDIAPNSARFQGPSIEPRHPNWCGYFGGSDAFESGAASGLLSRAVGSFFSPGAEFGGADAPSFDSEGGTAGEALDASGFFPSEGESGTGFSPVSGTGGDG